LGEGVVFIIAKNVYETPVDECTEKTKKTGSGETRLPVNFS
jgi:hypothetical protein